MNHNNHSITLGVMCWINSDVTKLVRTLSSLLVKIKVNKSNDSTIVSREESSPKVDERGELISILNDNVINSSTSIETTMNRLIDSHNFELIKSNSIHVCLCVDGISGKRFKDVSDLLKRLDRNEFNQLITPFDQSTQNDLYYKYLTGQIRIRLNQEQHQSQSVKTFIESNTTVNENIFNVIRVWSEFHKLYPNSSIIGTKYHTNLMINRNLFLSTFKNSFRLMIDDDDFSCSLDEKLLFVNQCRSVNVISKFKSVVVKSSIKQSIKNNSDSIGEWIVDDLNYRFGIWSVVIPPYTLNHIDYYFNPMEVSFEDSSFLHSFKSVLINSDLTNDKSIYYYLTPSQSCYDRNLKPYEKDVVNQLNTVVNRLEFNRHSTNINFGKYYYVYDSIVETSIGFKFTTDKQRSDQLFIDSTILDHNGQPTVKFKNMNYQIDTYNDIIRKYNVCIFH